MRYVIDIDGTICTDTDGDYEKAKPLENRISSINRLYDLGHHITYHSARGMSNPSGDRLHKMTQLTYTQLEEWGCKYHKLMLGKPAGDIYIDDKGITASQFFAGISSERVGLREMDSQQ